MEITEEQYARIKDSLPAQRGNISLTNLQVLNAILYIAEQGCKWRGLPEAVWPLAHDLYAHEPVGEKGRSGSRL
jgi:transposase